MVHPLWGGGTAWGACVGLTHVHVLQSVGPGKADRSPAAGRGPREYVGAPRAAPQEWEGRHTLFPRPTPVSLFMGLVGSHPTLG